MKHKIKIELDEYEVIKMKEWIVDSGKTLHMCSIQDILPDSKTFDQYLNQYDYIIIIISNIFKYCYLFSTNEDAILLFRLCHNTKLLVPLKHKDTTNCIIEILK